MILQTAVIVLIAGLTLFMALHGLYTALILALCSVFALAIAFNFAEPLAGTMYGSMPNFADALALALLFVVTLFVLRAILDRLLPGMVHFPLPLDRAGGAVFGAVSGMVMAGVLVTCLRLLPIGPTLLGFDNLDAGPTGGQPTLRHLWLRPDEFVTGLFKTLSVGSMKGNATFGEAHPDYQLEIAGFDQVAGSAMPFADDHALDPVTVTTKAGGKATYLAVGTEYPSAKLTKEQQDVLANAGAGKLVEIDIRCRPGDENMAGLSGGQAQLTVRRAEGGTASNSTGPLTRVLFPGWIIQYGVVLKPSQPAVLGEKVEAFGVTSVWKDKAAEKIGPPLIGLLYVVPEGYKADYLTVKRRTRTEVTMIGPDQAVVPPTAPTVPTAAPPPRPALTPATNPAGGGPPVPHNGPTSRPSLPK